MPLLWNKKRNGSVWARASAAVQRQVRWRGPSVAAEPHASAELATVEAACHAEPDSSEAVLAQVSALQKKGEPISDDLQERALRLQLAKTPDDFGLTRSLVALLHRLGRPPMPDAPQVALDADADVDDEGALLLKRVLEFADADDT